MVFLRTSMFCLVMVLLTGLCDTSYAAETANVSILRKTRDTNGSEFTRVVARYSVEIASGKAERVRGLSGRDTLASGHGMLFELDRSGGEDSFWMNGMKFPLDILFFSRDGTLIQILENLPVCSQCPLYPIPANAAYALEINAGQTLRNGISMGDELHIIKADEAHP